jgi:hypothetical protein
MHIPIYPVCAIDEARPDYLLVLPWNLKQEIVEQMRHVGHVIAHLTLLAHDGCGELTHRL